MLLQRVAPLYFSADEEAIQFLTTTIGAALFYLPSSKKLHYSGMTTAEALEGKCCKEHMFPRKVAAECLLLDIPHSVDELIRVCDTVYLRYNHVTPQQNRQLTPFQRRDAFTTPFDAYEKAGIELIPDPKYKK